MTPEQLKASILQRAMEGKLVPQDPTDEPASELLKRIKVEKEKLIADGKIKRDKKETELFRGADGKPYEKLADGTVKKVEVPYEIPDSWEWVRLKTIYQVINGDRGKNYPSKDKLFENGEIPFINAGNIANEVISSQNLLYLSEEQYNKLGNGKLIKGDVIFCLRGSLGKFGIFNMEKGAIASSLVIIRPYYNNSKDIDIYFSKYLASPVLLSEIRKYNNGTAQPNLSAKALNNFFIPLPPLAEQKRIVAQIERALEKVEAYAESYNKLQELDRAFPDKLKKSILQYAMQGKLVAQDPNDEPVEVLLEKIRAEKQKLYEEGKLKKKDLAEILTEKGDDNSPYGNNKENIGFSNSTLFKLPSSWCYVKFGGLVLFNIGKTPPRSEPNYWGNDIPWVSISDMSNNGYIIKTKEYLSDFAINQKKVKIAPAGTLLMSFKLTIGKVALLEIPASHNEAIISIFPYGDKENIIRDYLMRFLPLISTAGNSKDAIKGKTLNSTSISGLLIPISNYREMKDIVTKVDLLFEKVAQLYY